MPSSTPAPARSAHELRFQSLFNLGRGYTFPCDAEGHVDIDALGDRLRQNYFYARTCIGREFHAPAVHLAPQDATLPTLPIDGTVSWTWR